MEVESGAEQTQTLVIGAAIAGLALVRGDGHFHDSIPPHYLGALNHICTGRRERLIGGGVGGWGLGLGLGWDGVGGSGHACGCGRHGQVLVAAGSFLDPIQTTQGF